MEILELEKSIYQCPHKNSTVCKQRTESGPIPGGGPKNPKFVLLGLNPATRNDIWATFNDLESKRNQFMKECMNPSFGYGKLIHQLEALIPDFRIPRTVYLTDVVKCPTTDNTAPSDEMIEQCKESYWAKLITELDPTHIIVLGSSASRALNGPYVSGTDVKTSLSGNTKLWFIFAPHPSQKSHDQIACIAHNIASAIKDPSKFHNKSTIQSVISRNPSDTIAIRKRIQEKLTTKGYRRQGTKMVKENKTVNIVISQEFGDLVRVRWDCIGWKDDFATIYDYSNAGGPTCIVPLSKLFSSKFITEWKKKPSYKNNNGTWSIAFPADKEIPKLVLSFAEKWELL